MVSSIEWHICKDFYDSVILCIKIHIFNIFILELFVLDISAADHGIWYIRSR